jgi:hypothetical protein
MPSPEVEEFAELLVKYVRDLSIQSNDAVLNGNHILAKRWRNAGYFGSVKSIAKVLIPDIVDDTIFYLLHAIDDGGLQISFKASNGKVVNLTEDGLSELAGWYVGSDSFRERFSKERFTDYCPHIK